MSPTFKKVIVVIASAFLLFAMVYGSYLPFRKSSMFIDSIQNAGQAHTLQEYIDITAKPLDAVSPIGQEELVRNVAGTVMGIVGSNGAKNPAIIPPLLSFLDAYYAPILERGSGMSFDQNLYVLGASNEAAYTTLHDPKYLIAAQGYFEHGLLNSPKRPQFVYGLFDVYRMEGNLEKTREMYNLIMTYWPGDTRVKPVLDEFLKKYAEFSKNASSSKK